MSFGRPSLHIRSTPLDQGSIIWHRSQSKHMRNHLLNRRRRNLLTVVLLAMLLFRAYVPAGFMPASGTPFLVELCPATAPVPMSMPMPAHHHHADTRSHFENCPFGSATASCPAPVFCAVNPLPR